MRLPVRTLEYLTAITFGALLAAGPVIAHHSFSAEYDANQPLTLRGRVSQMDWVNPHCWIHLAVTRADGVVEIWMIEGGAPNALIRNGWTKQTLSPGTEIIVDGYRAKNRQQMVSGRVVTFPDGRMVLASTTDASHADFLVR
jgi:Family of unknown function (DUF6152)